MEANKSHNLPPVSWRSRKMGGVIQSKSKGLRIRVCLSLMTDDQCPSSNNLTEKAILPPFDFLF